MVTSSRSKVITNNRPAVSEALLRLQAIGLELPLHSFPGLVATTDIEAGLVEEVGLDKPLPLEPHELGKRTSSIYSFNTTISRIISLYGGNLEDDLPTMSEIHKAEAYRNTIAPLLSKQTSLPQLSATPPLPTQLRISTSTPFLKPQHSPKTEVQNTEAPSFAEFSRTIREFHERTASPISNNSYDRHRQDALNRLNSPSAELPQVPVDVSSSPFSGSVQPNDTGSVIPHEFCALNETDRHFQTERKTNLVPPEKQEVTVDVHARDDEQESSSSHSSRFSDSFVIYTGVREVLKHKIQQAFAARKNRAKAGKEDKLVRTTSSGRFDNQAKLSSKHFPGSETQIPSSSSPTHQAALINPINSNRTSLTVWPAQDMLRYRPTSEGPDMIPQQAPAKKERRREKQRAVSITPYQRHGIGVWFAENKRTRRKAREVRQAGRDIRHGGLTEGRRSHDDERSSTADGELSGQSQLIHALDRLTKSNSKRRRETLKQSIILVGPTIETLERSARLMEEGQAGQAR